jgi:hypothetical protein
MMPLSRDDLAEQERRVQPALRRVEKHRRRK